MRTKRTLTIATVLVALATLMSLGIFRGTRHARAQDQTPPPTNEVPPPIHDRISFGMVGITQGQTIRLNVVNAIPYDAALPPGPSRVAITFLDADGQRLRNRDGSVIRRVRQLEPGQATFLELNYDQLPPSPVRLQLRAVDNVIPPPVGNQPPPTNDTPPPVNDRIVTSVEVYNNANGRTLFVVSAVPAVQKVAVPPPVND